MADILEQIQGAREAIVRAQAEVVDDEAKVTQLEKDAQANELAAQKCRADKAQYRDRIKANRVQISILQDQLNSLSVQTAVQNEQTVAAKARQDAEAALASIKAQQDAHAAKMAEDQATIAKRREELAALIAQAQPKKPE